VASSAKEYLGGVGGGRIAPASSLQPTVSGLCLAAGEVRFGVLCFWRDCLALRSIVLYGQFSVGTGIFWWHLTIG